VIILIVADLILASYPMQLQAKTDFLEAQIPSINQTSYLSHNTEKYREYLRISLK